LHLPFGLFQLNHCKLIEDIHILRIKDNTVL
jgi:hypothetical protein